jgi:predicted nucleotidyltransferase component of viral defense system
MYNYSKKDLDVIASKTGFIRDNLEKTFRLADILEYLNHNGLMSEHLTLKGGTAINMTVFDLPRLSVDIDLDFDKLCHREEMLSIRKKINHELLNYMFSQAYALSPNTKNPHSLDSWVFYFQNAAGNRDNIKVEINYSMRNHIFPSVKKPINVYFLQKNFEIKTLSTIELFGSKIKALIERSAPRDLYDVNNMLKMNIISKDEQNLVRKTALFYLIVGGNEKISQKFDFEKITSLNFAQIRRSLIPVLKKNEPFDFETAKINVTQYLSGLMIFTEDEQQFIENFHQGIYQPDLLFEDQAIIERIKEHPMAIWRINTGRYKRQ